MLAMMADGANAVLNDSGEVGLARILRRGAIHHGRRQSTSRHAHFAWKLHVGLDAPVWSQAAPSRAAEVSPVVLVPPGVEHATGALGWSLAVFVAPGSRGTPFIHGTNPVHLGGATAQRIVDCCRQFDVGDRDATATFVEELAQLALPRASARERCDPRVQQAVELLGSDPDVRLPTLAKQVGLSLDRLSRLTRQHTGTNLRRLVLWHRLLTFLASNHTAPNIAAGAAAAGFADHAHLTRTFRACLGRVPSDFSSPPDALEAW